MTGNNFRYINDVSAYFADFDPADMTCPVCGKIYKRKKMFDEHIQKAVDGECATYRQLFAATITEETAHEVFLTFKPVMEKVAPAKLTAFRRDRSYRPTIDLVLHCRQHETDAAMLLQFTRSKNKWIKYFNQLLTVAMEDKTLKDYRKHLIAHEDLIDSVSFAQQNEDLLWNDELFVFDAIRKGHIGIKYMTNHFDLKRRLSDEFSDMTVYRLEKLLEGIKV